MSFEDFVAGYGRSLVRLDFVLTADRQVAEDLTQTVLADAYRHWQRVRAAASPETYARRMLVNAHLSRRWTTERPTDLRQATAQEPATSVPVPPTSAAGLPRGVQPGDPLPGGATESCVKEFSPTAHTENAFAFDGTVTGIGLARTERGAEPGPLELRSVTFRVHAWFKGGAGDTAVVDIAPPTTGKNGSEAPPAYQIGTRLLVSGMPRWGGAPLDDAIAWGCGFTRYHTRPNGPRRNDRASPAPYRTTA